MAIIMEENIRQFLRAHQEQLFTASQIAAALDKDVASVASLLDRLRHKDKIPWKMSTWGAYQYTYNYSTVRGYIDVGCPHF